jgi:serine/threonine protein kinase/WD40 repeat protein
MMNRDKVEAIFEAALALGSEAERQAYLAAACADPALRKEVETLLEAHRNPDSLLAEIDSSSCRARAPAVLQEAAGTVIGRYKLLERLGEGGMGVVYMAEQEEPVRRRVAFKIIKLGMDSKQVVARFEAERQALALMDHPNIAKVLDGGATDTGRPYFVMELVQGVPITEFCDKNRLSTEQRLKLFIPVCQAIQSAHQKGIIHRDLKPTNILVTLNPDGSGFPKVIDFGVAKATSQKLTEKTLFTAYGMIVGTPAYMSPEQAEMSHLDVDTRADIYSLGALLYELLTGSAPFPEQRLRSAGYNEMQRIILEEQPVKPSTRLSTLQGDQRSIVARNRGASELTLGRAFPGDLDWIVMKCLEKERARRYETANGLAHDIERHLRNEPVTARPPSRLYEFQKTLRRHRVGFAAVTAVLAALAIGVVVSTIEAVRARKAEQDQGRLRISAQRAEANEAKQKVAAQQFLYSSLVDQARAVRLARQVGYRDRVFALLKRAAALDVPQKNLADLRQEAVASMGDFVGLTPVTLTNFHTNILSATMDAIGNLAAFRLDDDTIELRQMPSGKEVARLMVTNAVLGDFCLNSTGDELLALCYANGAQVRSWSRDANGLWRETEKKDYPEITTGFVDTTKGLLAIVLTPVNKGPDWYHTVDWQVCSNSGPGTVRLWPHDPTDHEAISAKIRLLDPHTGAFVPGFEVTNAVPPNGYIRFRVSFDARTLAVQTWERITDWIQGLYDWEKGKLICEFSRTVSQQVLSLNPDGTCVVCWSRTSGTTAYTLPDLQPIGQFRAGVVNRYYDPCLSRNTLALRRFPYHENRIRLWNTSTRDDVAELDEPDVATPAGFSADGNSLLTYGVRHARYYRHNASEKLDLPARSAQVFSVAFSPDGRCLASADANDVLQVSDALTGQTLWQTNYPLGALDYSPDGQWLAVSHFESTLVSIREAQTGRQLFEVGTNVAGRIDSLQFSPDGRYLATACPGSGVKIWAIQATNGGLEATLYKSWERGFRAVFAPNSLALAFTALFTNNTVLADYVWDFLGSAEPRAVNFRDSDDVAGMSFTPDSRQLITCGNRGVITRVDVASGQRVSTFSTEDPGSQLTELPLRLSPDGSKLALCAASHLGVDIWDPKTGKRLYWFPEEVGAVLGLAWSPDSRRLAICRGSGNIAIWNLETVEQILAQLGLRP